MIDPNGKLAHPACINREERVVSQILNRSMEGYRRLRFVIPNGSLLGRLSKLTLQNKPK